MEQITSCEEAQEIRRLLWKSNVHHSVEKILPLVSILDEMNSLYTLQPHFPKIYFNTGFPFLVLPCDLTTESFSNKLSYKSIISSIRTTC
jgi:hypothetical protein